LPSAACALVAARRAVGRVAAVAAADDGAHLRQQRRQRAHRGGLAGAAVAEHQHAADAASTAATRMASFISSWPTMAEKGKEQGSIGRPVTGRHQLGMGGDDGPPGHGRHPAGRQPGRRRLRKRLLAAPRSENGVAGELAVPLPLQAHGAELRRELGDAGRWRLDIETLADLGQVLPLGLTLVSIEQYCHIGGPHRCRQGLGRPRVHLVSELESVRMVGG
jgi:hypothetical protein